MRLASLSLFALVAVTGCAGTRWAVADSSPLLAVTVAPAEVQGPVDRVLVAKRRATLIAELRAHGYQVLETPAAGVPLLTLTFDGAIVDDSKLHAADDPRHHIYNDLHYQFVAYTVQLNLVDATGHVVVRGTASSDADPRAAVAELTANLVRDVPAVASTYATR
jgi:hypothetical protein